MSVAAIKNMPAAPAAGAADFPLERVHQASWLALAILVAISLIAVTPPMALSVFVGGLVANGSFILLHRDLAAFIKTGPQRPRLFFFLKYYARLTALAALLFILVHKNVVSPVGLALGLSCVPAGILATAAIFFLKLHPLRKEAA